MPGTKIGGRKAAATNKKKYGSSFYADIGAKGGARGHTGGFAAKVACKCSLVAGDHYKVNCAGVKGGRRSRRGKGFAATAKRAPRMLQGPKAIDIVLPASMKPVRKIEVLAVDD
jgi:hypothetical protein